MVATISPTPAPTPTPTPRAEPADESRTGSHRLIILHAEHDGDDALVDLARRIGDNDHITLANIRPASAPTLPPALVACELGLTVYFDARASRDLEAERLDLLIAARSRLLRELGVAHDVVTETYHRSALSRVTARNLRKAMGRIAKRARADEIIVGPGVLREAQKID